MHAQQDLFAPAAPSLPEGLRDQEEFISPGEEAALLAAPRSAHVLRGVARWGWQHRIAPALALRCCITFRTRRV